MTPRLLRFCSLTLNFFIAWATFSDILREPIQFSRFEEALLNVKNNDVVLLCNNKIEEYING